jgi:hypothetical protein
MSGLAALLALSVAAGCSGKLDSAAAGTGTNGATGPGATPMGTGGTSTGPGTIPGAGGTSTIPVTMNPPDPTIAGTTPIDVNRVPIHRLNQAEYDNTMKDLLGVTSTPANSFIADETAYGFDNIAEAFNMTDVRFEQYYNAADMLVDTVFADPTLTAKIMTCTPAGAADTACIGQIISSFGMRAWRRPITAAEVTRLTQVATDAIALGTDATGGVKQVVKTMLASLPFLYRVEMDATPNSPTAHALDPYELASRLSYLTWSSMPDDMLFGLAQNGTLVNNDVLSAQVDRMMADPKANSFVLNFAGQWLGMRKLLTHAVDAGAYPAWTQAQATQMAAALSS